MFTKVVYNQSPYSFRLSDATVTRWKERSGKECLYGGLDIPRADPDLVFVVETMGAEANGGRANMMIRSIPKGTRYVIIDYEYGGDEVKLEDEFDWFTA
jgi:hypothetical protein